MLRRQTNLKINIIKRKITKEDIGKSAFFPGSATAEKEFEKRQCNVHYIADVKKPRNIKHHDLVFGLANYLSFHAPENSPWNNCTPYKFIKGIMHEAGITDFYMLSDGEIVEYAQSIAFENMDEIEFGKINDLIFFHVSRILKIEEDYLRKNYKEILENDNM
jgi:hypothetical protein